MPCKGEGGERGEKGKLKGRERRGKKKERKFYLRRTITVSNKKTKKQY